jgi:hypothetical protein
LYTAHLATGNHLVCLHLKGATIEAHLRDIAKFLRRFCLIAPRYLQATDIRIAAPISAFINEVKRVERMPNKHEPFTLAMVVQLAIWAAEYILARSFERLVHGPPDEFGLPSAFLSR